MRSAGQRSGGLRASVFALVAALVVFSAIAGSCDAAGDGIGGRPLRVTHHVGGAQRVIAIVDGVWFQTCGCELLRIDPATCEAQTIARLGGVGIDPPAIDMIAHDGALFIVLEDDAVLRVEPRGAAPGTIDRIDAERLGIRPRRLSVVGDEVLVSGVGGVVRARDGTRVYRTEDDLEAGTIVLSERGPVVTIGRRIYTTMTGDFVGSASELIPVPTESSIPASFIFVRRGTVTDVGLMTEAFREVDARTRTIGIEADVRRVRLIDDRIWVIPDGAVRAYAHRDDALVPVWTIDRADAFDLAALDDDRIAMAGGFGRAVYRLPEDGSQAEPMLERLAGAPGAIKRAVFDGRHVLIDGGGGPWLYTIGESIEPTESGPRRSAPIRREAATIHIGARIADDGLSVMLTARDLEAKWAAPEDVAVSCLAAVDGRIWVGHERGVTVLSGRPPKPADVLGDIRLDGPVLHLFPLLRGGGAVYVTRHGGLGVARLDESAVEASE
jgi:hypothetical protein